MSDDPNGRVITFPGGDQPYVAPPIPRYADTAREPEAPETTPEFPTVPQPPQAASFLWSEGIPAQPPAAAESDDAEYEEGGEYEDSGEYSERRSLAEVIADWLQFRVDSARAERDGHAPFREAQVADKVSRLNAQTEREMSLMAQHNELQKAHVDARAAQVSARGKSAAIGSGSEAGKGFNKSSQRGTGGGAPNRGPGGPGGGQQRNVGRDRNSDSTRKGPGGSSGGPNGPGRPPNSSGGANGRQGGPGGGWGASGGTSGNGGSGSPGSSAAERSRARQQRRSTRQDADLADRTADRAQTRQNRQRVWDDKQAERKSRREDKEAERKARRDPEKGGDAPRTLAGVVVEELKRRRRRGEGKDGDDKASVKPDDPAVKADDPSLKADDPSLKVDLTKGPKDKDTAEGATASGPEPETAPDPKPDGAAGTGGDTASGSATGNDWISFLKDVFDKADQTPPGGGGPGLDPEPETVFAGNPDQVPGGAAGTEEDDIPDAEIVEDEGPTKATTAVGSVPEPDPEPSGEARPAARTRARTVGRQRMARQHRTDISFDEYLAAMANIAVNSAADYQMVKEAVEHLKFLAIALREMSADLGGSHNIDRKVTNLMADLADLAATTAREADRLAQESERAATVAVVAAQSVAKVYSEDLAAMDEGGLDQASAAVHHN